MVRSKILTEEKGIDHCFLDAKESLFAETERLLLTCRRPQQVHGSMVSMIDTKFYYGGCDGLVSKIPATLAIASADCLPLFLYCKDKSVITALHAGWRSLLAGIIENSLKMLHRMNVTPANIYAALGPRIGVCCYQVKFQLVENFIKEKNLTGHIYEKRGKQYFLDLAAVAKSVLVSFGVHAENIDDTKVCTFCSPGYFSFRRDKTEMRNYSFLTLK